MGGLNNENSTRVYKPYVVEIGELEDSPTYCGEQEIHWEFESQWATLEQAERAADKASIYEEFVRFGPKEPRGILLGGRDDTTGLSDEFANIFGGGE